MIRRGTSSSVPYMVIVLETGGEPESADRHRAGEEARDSSGCVNAWFFSAQRSTKSYLLSLNHSRYGLHALCRGRKVRINDYAR